MRYIAAFISKLAFVMPWKGDILAILGQEMQLLALVLFSQISSNFVRKLFHVKQFHFFTFALPKHPAFASIFGAPQTNICFYLE